MKHKREYRILGICKHCGQEIYGDHSNKYQAHQRWCLKNPNRNKAVDQLKNASKLGSKVSNANRSIKAKTLNEKHKHILYCKRCNKPYEIWISDRDFEKGYYSKHCSYACSNVRDISKVKDKISQSVKQEHKHTCPKCHKEFMHRGTSIHTTFCDSCYKETFGVEREFHKHSSNTILHQTKCKECKKTIWCKTMVEVYCYDCAKKLNKRIYQLYTPGGKKLLSKETRQKLSKSIQTLVSLGKHKGWTTRNNASFAELFWQKVLINNGIQYETEMPVPGYLYRLDFKITLPNGKIVDLEIDGKQHYYADRNQHDILRDKRIRALGYLVYRIPWNSITTKLGKMRMKAKINQFLWWLDKVSK